MTHRRAGVAGLLLALLLPLSLQAHRAWMVPSSTIVSGDGMWVTVDAAVSNDLFYFDHQPLRLDNLVVTAPDGTAITPENASTGRYRSTFDIRLAQQGTYKIATVTDSVTASYDEAGEVKHWQGSWAAFTKEVPPNAPNLAIQRTTGRNEIFVTSGKPSNLVLKPAGAGLELVPVTHPNDLVSGEPATLALLLDGKPVANVSVAVIAGGIRYRDRLDEREYHTDKDGRFVVSFEEPGMYWLNANYQEGGAVRRQGGRGRGAITGPQAGRGQRGRGPQVPAGPVSPGRRASYTATLEVMPQ